MTLEEAKEFAQKVSHDYFTDEEYMTMKGNIICFEDGVRTHFHEWTKDKEWINNGWNLFSGEK